MTLTINKKILIVFALILFLGVFAAVANANNSWSKYHFDISTKESKANPLVIGNNVTSVWDSSLAGASADWNLSVLKNQIVKGTNINCNPILGQIEVCNDTYGTNGWLGIAQVWVYQGVDGHIAQALVKMNDTYFGSATSTSTFNTPAWRNFVVCQEVGHTFGLSHQDENFDNANLDTCMDYTSNPDSNQHPNLHDYDMLNDIYAHLNIKGSGKGKPDKGNGGDNGNGNGKKPKKAGIGLGQEIDLNDASAWGQAVRKDARGNTSLFERDLGNGLVLLTYVIWTD